MAQLKSNQDLCYEYVLCDAKPPGIIIAKKVTPKHKEMLTEETGNKNFHIGECWFEEGQFVFEPAKPASGLGMKVRDGLHHHTGKKHPVSVASADGEPDGEQPPKGASEAGDGGVASATKVAADAAVPGAAPAPVPELVKAPKDWDATCATLVTHINGLGKAIQAQCAGEAADFTKEINGYVEKLESRISKLGTKLADSLAKANEAKDVAARKAELNNAKAIIAQTIKDVKPLAVVIDENPFVKTNFTGELTGGLTRAAQAVTRGLAA
jgi:hypothetical protein